MRAVFALYDPTVIIGAWDIIVLRVKQPCVCGVTYCSGENRCIRFQGYCGFDVLRRGAIQGIDNDWGGKCVDN